MPQFRQQPVLYEVRERHSNTYSWFVLLLSNILTEIPYNVFLGIMSFAAYYYAVLGIRTQGNPNPRMIDCLIGRLGLRMWFSTSFVCFGSIIS